MKIVGVVIILIVIVMLMTLAGSLSMFMDIPSLIFVLGIGVGTVITRHGFKGVTLLWQQDNKKVLYTLGNAALMAGLLGTMIAKVSMLSNAPITHLGPSTAVALLSSLYGILVFLLSFALNPKDEISTSSAVLLATNLVVVTISYAVGISMTLPQVS